MNLKDIKEQAEFDDDHDVLQLLDWVTEARQHICWLVNKIPSGEEKFLEGVVVKTAKLLSKLE